MSVALEANVRIAATAFVVTNVSQRAWPRVHVVITSLAAGACPQYLIAEWPAVVD
jgi:hypothetical protein